MNRAQTEICAPGELSEEALPALAKTHLANRSLLETHLQPSSKSFLPPHPLSTPASASSLPDASFWGFITNLLFQILYFHDEKIYGLFMLYEFAGINVLSTKKKAKGKK